MQKCISSCYTLNYTIYKHFTSNIAEKKANELYNCELYNRCEIQFSLALYKRSVYIVFLFLYKARKTYIFLLYTYNYAIYIHFNSIQLYAKLIMQLQRNRPANYTIQASELYNLSQRIIQLYMYSKLYSFMFAMKNNYAKFAIAYKYEFFVCYM